MQKPAGQYSCLLENHEDRHGLERPASAACAPCLPVGRPQNTMPGRRSPNRHADAVEAALTTAEGQAPPPNRPPACRHPSPSSARGWNSPASKPAPRTAGHGADFCPLPGSVKMRARADDRRCGTISRAGSAAVGAAPARRRQGRSTRPPPIPSQACRAACFQACARCPASGMRAPPDVRRARAARALGMHAPQASSSMRRCPSASVEPNAAPCRFGIAASAHALSRPRSPPVHARNHAVLAASDSRDFHYPSS